MPFIAGDVFAEVAEGFERRLAESADSLDDVQADVASPSGRLVAFVKRAGLVAPEFNGQRVDWGVVDFDFHFALVLLIDPRSDDLVTIVKVTLGVVEPAAEPPGMGQRFGFDSRGIG